MVYTKAARPDKALILLLGSSRRTSLARSVGDLREYTYREHDWALLPRFLEKTVIGSRAATFDRDMSSSLMEARKSTCRKLGTCLCSSGGLGRDM